MTCAGTLAALGERRFHPVVRRALGPAVAAGGVLAAGVAIRNGPEWGAAGYALGWVWGLLVLAALVGWGRFLERLFRPGRSLGWGLRGTVGLAAAVAAGGVLELLGAISPATVLAGLAAGAGFLVLDARPFRRRNGDGRSPAGTAAATGLALVALLGLIQYSAAVNGTIDTVNSRPAFDPHDDLQAYLVFPEKMLQTGAMGSDPFEPRRVLSLGGQSFLQTLVLVARPVRQIHLLDEGIALLLLAGMALGGRRLLSIDPRLAVVTALLVLAMPHLPMRGNTSALLTGVALMLGWFLLEMARQGAGRPGRGWVLPALLAAAACAVKSTFIAFAVPFFAVLAIAGLAAPGDRRRALLETVGAGALILLLVAPWMVSAYRSSGTPLYPVLGHGFVVEASARGFPALAGDFSRRTIDVVRAAWKHTFVLWPVAVLLAVVEDRRRRRPVLALGIAVVAAALLSVAMGDPNLNRSLNRYVFPLLMAGAAGLLLASFEGTRQRGRQRLRIAAAAGLAVAGLLFLHGADRTWRMGDQMLIDAWHGVRGGPWPGRKAREAVRRLQEALPPGATVLETLARPFLLDLARNRVLVMSLPGFSSPPPGLPLDGGAEAVARHLGDQGIRYVAYGGVRSVRSLLDLTEKDIRDRYPRSRMRWAMLRYHERYREIVLELARSRKVLFADGDRVVLDLDTPEHAILPALVPERSGFFRDHGWTDGHGVLGGLRWTVPEGADGLLLELDRAHPDWGEPETLGVRVVVDGAALEPVRLEPGRFLFRLPPGIRTINRVEVLSSTFVPADRGIGNDRRTLGVPVQRIVLVTIPAGQ